MKKFFKCILIVLLCLIVALIRLVINIAFKFDFKIWWLESEWSAGDALSFYGTVLSFIGTISLGIVTIWQTKKSNEISKKLLDKDLLESIDFILIENKIEVNKKENNDSTIIYFCNIYGNLCKCYFFCIMSVFMINPSNHLEIIGTLCIYLNRCCCRNITLK